MTETNRSHEVEDRMMNEPTTSLRTVGRDLEIFPLAVGMWQVSGGHGKIEPESALRMMSQFCDAGFNTFDMADHYGPAEDLVGQFRNLSPAAAKSDSFYALTKWCPQPSDMSRSVVEAAVLRAGRRMKTDCIDLMQFHWWDYEDKRFLEALQHLRDLREEGRLREVALTNFDTRHLELILEAGIPIVSNQVQFSVVDRRPLARMIDLCQSEGIQVLAYGTLLGGLISPRFLGGPEPGSRELTTASLRKYKQMIDVWGGWELFQQLLEALEPIADRHEVSIPNVAVAYVLGQPQVAAAIIGCRLGQSEHIEDNLQALTLHLSPDEVASIDAVAEKGADLMKKIGDCGDEYRRARGRA